MIEVGTLVRVGGGGHWVRVLEVEPPFALVELRGGQHRWVTEADVRVPREPEGNGEVVGGPLRRSARASKPRAGAHAPPSPRPPTAGRLEERARGPTGHGHYEML